MPQYIYSNVINIRQLSLHLIHYIKRYSKKTHLQKSGLKRAAGCQIINVVNIIRNKKVPKEMSQTDSSLR